MIAIHDIGDPTDQSRAAGHPAEPVATPAQLLRSHLPGQHVAPDGGGSCVVPALSSDMREVAEKSQSLARVEEWLPRAGAWGNALVTGGIAQHLVATMNALGGPLSPAFIVGFLAPVQLSTTNADSAFVVATKDSPPKLTYFEGRQYLVDRQALVRQDCSHTGTLQIFLRLESDAILWLKNGKKETL